MTGNNYDFSFENGPKLILDNVEFTPAEIIALEHYVLKKSKKLPYARPIFEDSTLNYRDIRVYNDLTKGKIIYLANTAIDIYINEWRFHKEQTQHRNLGYTSVDHNSPSTNIIDYVCNQNIKEVSLRRNISGIYDLLQNKKTRDYESFNISGFGKLIRRVKPKSYKRPFEIAYYGFGNAIYGVFIPTRIALATVVATPEFAIRLGLTCVSGLAYGLISTFEIAGVESERIRNVKNSVESVFKEAIGGSYLTADDTLRRISRLFFKENKTHKIIDPHQKMREENDEMYRNKYKNHIDQERSDESSSSIFKNIILKLTGNGGGRPTPPQRRQDSMSRVRGNGGGNTPPQRRQDSMPQVRRNGGGRPTPPQRQAPKPQAGRHGIRNTPRPKQPGSSPAKRSSSRSNNKGSSWSSGWGGDISPGCFDAFLIT